MTMEGFRPCSPGVPLVVVELLAAAEPPCAMVPFTGDSEAPFACCAGTEAPAGVGGACVAVVEALGGPGSCAGTAPERGVGVLEGALDCGGRAGGGAALVIRMEQRAMVACGLILSLSLREPVSDRQATADVKSGGRSLQDVAVVEERRGYAECAYLFADRESARRCAGGSGVWLRT